MRIKLVLLSIRWLQRFVCRMKDACVCFEEKQSLTWCSRYREPASAARVSTSALGGSIQLARSSHNNDIINRNVVTRKKGILSFHSSKAWAEVQVKSGRKFESKMSKVSVAFLLLSNWINRHYIHIVKKFRISSFEWYKYRYTTRCLCDEPVAQSSAAEQNERTPCTVMEVEATGSAHNAPPSPTQSVIGKSIKTCLDIIVLGIKILFPLFHVTAIHISVVILQKSGSFVLTHGGVKGRDRLRV